MKILGISAYYHDSAIAVLEDDSILFALQEERLSRVKADSVFPKNAISQALTFLNANSTQFTSKQMYGGGGEMKSCALA